MTAMRLKRYPSPSGGFALGKMGVGATMLKQGKTARDYVQDGLIAMWDGIENAGWGTHDASATIWKDLSPSHCDMENQQGMFDSTFYWQDKGIYCDDGSAKKFFGKIGGLPQSIVDAVNSGNITVEGVQKHLRSINAGYLISQLRTGSGNSNQFAIQSPVAGGRAAFGNVWGSWSVNYGLTASQAPLLATSPSYICVTKKSDRSVSSLCIVSGLSYTATGTSSTDTSMNASGRLALAGMGGDAFWGGRNTACVLYAVRIYNRILTSNEIAANYAIDQERFNLP